MGAGRLRLMPRRRGGGAFPPVSHHRPVALRRSGGQHEVGVVGAGEPAVRQGGVRAGNPQRLPVVQERHGVDVGAAGERADDLPVGEDLVAAPAPSDRLPISTVASPLRSSTMPVTVTPVNALVYPASRSVAVGPASRCCSCSSIAGIRSAGRRTGTRPVSRTRYSSSTGTPGAGLAVWTMVGVPGRLPTVIGRGAVLGRHAAARRHRHQHQCGGESRNPSRHGDSLRNSTRNRAPPPGRSSDRATRPPCAAACWATSASPSPVPSLSPRARAAPPADEPVEDRLAVLRTARPGPSSSTSMTPPVRRASQPHRDRAAAVAWRVVQQVADDLLDPAPVHPPRRGAPSPARDEVRRQAARVGRPAGPAPPRRPGSRWTGWSLRASSSRSLTSGWNRSISSATSPAAGAGALVEVLPAPGQHAGRRGQGLQRRAQLVADVGGEPAVPFDAVAASWSTISLNEVVSRARSGSVAGSRRAVEVAGGDLLGRVGDRRQRAQPVPGGVPAERRRRPRRCTAATMVSTSASTRSVWSSSRSESTS